MGIMRAKLSILAIVLFAGTAAAQQPKSAETVQMPVSYICPMDAEVLDDKPGTCPICKMELEAVRIEQAWSCPGNTVRLLDKPGKCPTNRALDLVPITVSHFFKCEGSSKSYADPGSCADGSARVEKREVRAHGDHNPRHGGQFFMAEDAWHHLEGTYPASGVFRGFVYDNFTKALAPGKFTGRVVVAGSNESVPLKPSRDGKTLEANLKTAAAPAKDSPVVVTAFVKFTEGAREQPFDFTFTELSKEPVVAPTTTRAPAAAAVTASATPAPAVQAPAAEQAPLVLDTPLNMPPGLAEATDESRLPTTTAGLVTELESRAREVEKLVNDGSLAQVWLPAMGTKTVALAINERSSTLPERQRIAASAAVMQIVTASWEIDAYGDLGNRQKITEAYRRLASAVASLKAIYAQ